MKRRSRPRPPRGLRPGHQGGQHTWPGADRATFEAFYRAHFDEVLGFVTRRVADPYTAADLTADVFVRALEAAASYRGEGSAGAWLIGIARHVVAAEYRRAARDQAAVQRVDGSRLLDADDIGRLEDRIDAERQARGLYERVRLLAPGEREVLELVAIDGLSVSDAAAAAGISRVAARVRLHRARCALREIVSPQDQGGNAGPGLAPLEVQL